MSLPRKLNRANRPIIRNIMSGLDTVKANPVSMSFLGVDWLSGFRRRSAAGTEYVYAEGDEHQRAEELEYVLVACEELFYKGEAEGCDYAVHEV